MPREPLSNWIVSRTPVARVSRVIGPFASGQEPGISLSENSLSARPSPPPFVPPSTHRRKHLSVQDKLSVCRSSSSVSKVAKSYSVAEKTVRKIKRVGEKEYQSRMNCGGSNRKRERAFNSSRQDSMTKVHETLLGLLNCHSPTTRDRVLQLMSEHGVFWEGLSEKAKERAYKHFRYVFG